MIISLFKNTNDGVNTEKYQTQLSIMRMFIKTIVW